MVSALTRRKRPGGTLVEVVIAMVVLALVVPPLMVQFSASAAAQKSTLIEHNLLQLADERLGMVLADHANPTRGYDYVTGSNYPDETDPLGFTGYTRTTTVREVSAPDFVAASPGSGLKRVRILVTGPDSRALAIDSFVADIPDPNAG